jgi:hypothetical protein
MDLARKLVVLLVAVGPPAVAHTYFAAPFAAPPSPCFSSGTMAYRVSSTAPAPDYRVRVDNNVKRADLRIHLVDRADTADFMLIDDGLSGNACGPPVKTISLAGEARPADMVVSLAPDAASADYKLFVRSARFSPHDAAALFAVMTMTTPKYQVVEHR